MVREPAAAGVGVKRDGVRRPAAQPVRVVAAEVGVARLGVEASSPGTAPPRGVEHHAGGAQLGEDLGDRVR